MAEVTSSARLARMFGWLLKRHTILSFYLYTAGFVRWAVGSGRAGGCVL